MATRGKKEGNSPRADDLMDEMIQFLEARGSRYTGSRWDRRSIRWGIRGR